MSVSAVYISISGCFPKKSPKIMTSYGYHSHLPTYELPLSQGKKKQVSSSAVTMLFLASCQSNNVTRHYVWAPRLFSLLVSQLSGLPYGLLAGWYHRIIHIMFTLPTLTAPISSFNEEIFFLLENLGTQKWGNLKFADTKGWTISEKSSDWKWLMFS